VLARLCGLQVAVAVAAYCISGRLSPEICVGIIQACQIREIQQLSLEYTICLMSNSVYEAFQLEVSSIPNHDIT